jgi:hypothetical protein
MKIKKKELKELVNPKNFNYFKGDDYGKGRQEDPAKISVSSTTTTDDVATATQQDHTFMLPSGISGGFIGEEELSEKVFPKSDEDKGIVDIEKNKVTKLMSMLDDIDFSIVDSDIKSKIIKKVNG